MKRPSFFWTIRTRLTLLYAGGYLLAGAVLILGIYLSLGQVLDPKWRRDGYGTR